MWLDRLWISGSCLEKQAMRAVKPRSMWEYGAVLYAVQYTYLMDFHATDESVLKITYEELIANTKESLERIYNLIGLPTDIIESTLDCLQYDSQAHSPLARDILQKHKADDLPSGSVERARQIAHILRLPNDFFLPGFRFDHNKYTSVLDD
jgi:hypothetical protein